MLNFNYLKKHFFSKTHNGFLPQKKKIHAHYNGKSTQIMQEITASRKQEPCHFSTMDPPN